MEKIIEDADQRVVVERVIFEDVDQRVVESTSEGWPDTAGAVRTIRTEWAPGREPAVTVRRERMEQIRATARLVAKGEAAFTAAERDGLLAALVLEHLADDAT